VADLMEFPCPACGALLRAPHMAAGRQGTCNKCKMAFIVPAQFDLGGAEAPARPAPGAGGPAAAPMINPFERLPPPPKPKPGMADMLRQYAPLAIGVLVVVGGGLWAWSYFSDDDAEGRSARRASAPAGQGDAQKHDQAPAGDEHQPAAAAPSVQGVAVAVGTPPAPAKPAAPEAPASRPITPPVAPPAVPPVKQPPVAAAPVSPAAHTATTISQKVAEQLVASGRVAMQESNDIPSRSVAAAVAFSKAIKYYEATGDVDRVCDLEANIFWCKKRMAIDDVKAFVALKADDRSITEALATADAVATKDIPKAEAAHYLERANAYAKDHPGDFEQISVRYFEVAERFVGTEVSITAQKLSLEAQQKQMKQIQADKEAQRQTLFTASSAAQAAAGQLAAVPTADALKSAVSAIRKLYKDDYAKTKPNQKRRLAAKLLEQVSTTSDDPVAQYALLNEALDLSVAASDWYSAVTICDALPQYAKGIDAKAKKKEVFGKAHANATTQAILKLLDNPEDAEANAVVGKFFCFEGGKWSVGLPLLAHGGDVDYKAAAEMELLHPASAAQQIELADKWYDLGKKARPGARESLLARAYSWYKQADSAITGITKQRLAQRIEEIDGLLPLTNVDYDNLTPKQWDHLKGAVVEVSAGKDRNDIGISIVHGQRVRVVPHPTDTWTSDYFNTPITVTWKGYQSVRSGTFITTYGFGEFPIGALVMQIEQGKQLRPGILEGEGRIFLGPYVAGWGSGGTGKIRCKVIPVTDDDADQGSDAPATAGHGAAPADQVRILLGKWNRSTGEIFVFQKDGAGNNGKTPISWVFDGQRYIVTYPEHPGWLDQVIIIDAAHAKCITTGKERIEDMVKVVE